MVALVSITLQQKKILISKQLNWLLHNLCNSVKKNEINLNKNPTKFLHLSSLRLQDSLFCFSLEQ